MSQTNTETSIDQLCPNCGLCCDSTLFADVELRATDDEKQLKKLGITLFKKGKTKRAFAQPCPCFDGRLCKIYADRPKRCGLFECGLLKRVAAHEMTAAAALKKITTAKKQAERIRTLLRTLGQQDESMALTHRYGEAMSSPIDLSEDNVAEAHGQLMLAVNELMQGLQRDFLQ